MTEDTSTRATQCNAMRTESSDWSLGTPMTSDGPSHPNIFPSMNHSFDGSYDETLSSSAPGFALSTDSMDIGVMLSPVPTHHLTRPPSQQYSRTATEAPVEFNMTTSRSTLQSFTPYQRTTPNFPPSYQWGVYMEQSIPSHGDTSIHPLSNGHQNEWQGKPQWILEDNPLNIKQEQSKSFPEVMVRYQSQEDWSNSLTDTYINSPLVFKEANEDVTKEKLYKLWGLTSIESPVDTQSSVPLEGIPSCKNTVLAELPKTKEADSCAMGGRKRKKANKDSRHEEVQDDRCTPKSAKRQSRHTKPGRPTVSIPKLVVKGELGRQNLSKEEVGERHKACEKRRRRDVRKGFDDLRGLMPELRKRRPTKADVLEAAAEWVEDLQKCNKELTAQVIALEERKKHQQ